LASSFRCAYNNRCFIESNFIAKMVNEYILINFFVNTLSFSRTFKSYMACIWQLLLFRCIKGMHLRKSNYYLPITICTYYRLYRAGKIGFLYYMFLYMVDFKMHGCSTDIRLDFRWINLKLCITSSVTNLDQKCKFFNILRKRIRNRYRFNI
jgi:hypothetical protein